MIKRTVLLRMLLLCAALALASAQTVKPQQRQEETQPAPQASAPSTPQQAETQPSADVPEENADLAITANVTARELRFETVPETRVEFTGQPERRTQWDAARENLPRPVQPGVTYRNIGVRLKIVSVFADIDRIVAEALGEVPVSDELPAPAAPAQGQSSNPAGAKRP